LIIDEALGVVVAKKNDFQLRPEFQESLRYFTAVVNEGGQPALLVNLERIVDRGFYVKDTKTPVSLENTSKQLIAAACQ